MKVDNTISLSDRLKSKSCHAGIVNRARLQKWQMAPDACHLTIKGGTLLHSNGGWVTGLNNACLAQALDYALEVEIGSGYAQLELEKWLAPAACTSRRSSEVVESGFDSTRRKGGEGAAASSAGEQAPQLGVLDMAGLFIVFGSAVVIVLIIKVLRKTLCPAFSGDDKEEHSWQYDIKQMSHKLDDCTQQMAVLTHMCQAQTQLIHHLTARSDQQSQQLAALTDTAQSAADNKELEGTISAYSTSISNLGIEKLSIAAPLPFSSCNGYF